MSAHQAPTLERIKEVGFAEFLDKGFHGASLRKIVKLAGVTTGAFYGYYKSKEALFEDLVKPHYRFLMNYIDESISDFSSLDIEEQAAVVGSYRQEQFEQLITHIYTNRDVFTLLLFRSQGTKFEHTIDEIAKIETAHTMKFLGELADRYGGKPNIRSCFSSMVMRTFFVQFFELIARAETVDEAILLVTQLKIFNTAGWMHLMDSPGLYEKNPLPNS